MHRNQCIKTIDLPSSRSISVTRFLIIFLAIGLGYSASGCGFSGTVVAQQATSQMPTTPFISPAGGTYTKGINVTIVDATPGTTIYYTTDGSTPTVKSTPYVGPIAIATASTTMTVRAFAVRAGVYGSATSATYVIVPPLPALPAPSFSPAPGYYMGAQNVSLTAPQPGGTIYYTLDGTNPTTSSQIYGESPVHIAQQTTIKAFTAGVSGYVPSSTEVQTYSIIPATPAILPAAGTYTTGITIKVSDATPGTTLYYTTDGSTPTTASARYTIPISLPTTSAQKTFRALATLNGVSSSIASSSFTIAPVVTVPTPVISPGSGSYSVNPTITIADSLSSAKIYYTIDGSTPSSQSTLYSGPWSLLQTKTGTTVVKAIAVMNGDQPSAVAQSKITLNLSGTVIATTMVNTNIAPVAIPADFLGFSHEWVVAQTIMGQATTGVNQIYRTLVGTLSTAMGGPLVLRIGGGSTDVSGPATVGTVTPFVELAQASNVKFILGVNLGSNNLSLAEQQVATYSSSLPRAALAGLEIGNEPDGYPSNGLRSSTYSPSDYLPQFQEWAKGIEAAAGSPVPIAGPALGGVLPWEPYMQADVTNSSLQASIVTQHKYVACYYTGSPLPADILLLPTSSTESLFYLQPYAEAAHEVHARFRIGELNSICNGGQPGVSNSFSSALWAIDTMFEYANISVDGVNWNTNADGGPYDLFHFNTWENKYVLKTVNPLYYGLLFFARAAGRNAQVLNTSTLSNANVKVWVTKDSLGHAHLVIINKEPAVTGNCQITIAGYTSGMMTRLTASSYTATSGVTIGGQTYDGSQDGTLQGSLSTEPISPVNDIWTIPVNAMSAVEVDLQP